MAALKMLLALALSTVWKHLYRIRRSYPLFSCHSFPTSHSASLLVCDTSDSNLTSTNYNYPFRIQRASSYCCRFTVGSEGMIPQTAFESKHQLRPVSSTSNLRLRQDTVGIDFDGLSPHRLNLYKISVIEEAELHEHLSALGSGRLLRRTESVEMVFNDVPFFQKLRVVVEPGAERPSFIGSATSEKRAYLKDPFEANKRIRHDFSTHSLQTPSIIAMPFNFQEYYEKNREPHICCG